MKSPARVMGALLCLLIAQTLSAQNTEYTNFADNAFQHLDKTPITTGILYDRVSPLANMHGFNPATDTVSSELFEQGYFELYNAAYNKNSFLKPDDVTLIRDAEADSRRIPIFVLDYQFNWMDTFAIEQNLFSLQNGLLYDVPGRTQNPYKTTRVQMAAPLYETMKPGTISFMYRSYQFLRNQGLSVQQIRLDFPGVGVAILSVSAGGYAELTFPSVGDYVGTITVTYTDGTSFSHKYILTTSVPVFEEEGEARMMGTLGTNDPPCWSRSILSTRTFQGYDEPQAYRGRLEMNFYYRLNDPAISCNNSEQGLRKPVILIDGFDPTDKRDATIIYNFWLRYNAQPGQVKNLGEELRQQGHDVIIINIPGYTEGIINIPFPGGGTITIPRKVRGGGDYIERNALTLVDVIDYVNSHLVDPNDKITVVGPSMGGQISRYALRWMETNNLRHNCRLWISMDSPHQGAVLPISLQWLVRGLANVSKKAKEMINHQINVPAAKQQLIHHHLSGTEYPAGAPGFFNRYYDLLNGAGWDGASRGWPQLPRRVAINSGAHNGLQQYGNSCGDAFWMKIRPRNWLRVLFAGSIGLRAEGTARFAPSAAQGRCQALDFWMNTLVGAFPLTGGYAQHAGPYSQSLELLPGGSYPGFRELYDGMDAGNMDYAVKVEKTLYYSNHVHIPTASALAYGKGPSPNPNRRWDDDVSNLNLGMSCGTGEIPFVTYQGPRTWNTVHDLLFDTQVQFLKDEIFGNIATIPGLSISGPSNVCNYGASNFTVHMPSGGTVTWSVSGISANITPTSSNSVAVTPLNNPSGFYTLIANVTANCVTTSVQKQVVFNTGSTYSCSDVGNGTCDVQVPRCSGQYNAERGYFIPNNIPDVPKWHWWVYGGKFRDGSTSQVLDRTHSINYVTPDFGSGSCVLYIRPYSSCGIEGTEQPFKYIIINTGSPCFSSFTMSPNPATSSVTISTDGNHAEKIASAQKDNSITAIKIYDQHGLLKKQQTYGKVRTANIYVNDLPNGIYMLEIISKDFKEQKKLLVQH